MEGRGGRIAEVNEARSALLGLVSELLRRLEDPSIRELEVKHGDIRVKVSRDEAGSALEPPDATGDVALRGARVAVGETATPGQGPPGSSAAGDRDPTGAHARAIQAASTAKTVTAPLTGILYRSSSPQAAPFVQVGSVVGVGDIVALIEAMKLFNEVRSTVAGRVRRIAAESGQLVRAHQPLLELE